MKTARALLRPARCVGTANRLPLHLAASSAYRCATARCLHVDSYTASPPSPAQATAETSEEALEALAHREALMKPEVQAVLAEWKMRLDSIDAGQSDCLARMASQSRADPKQVFVNNDMLLSEMEAVGADFDYSLVGYTDALQQFIYSSALKILIEKRQYPQELASKLSFDPTFPIRGLMFDPQHGNLLKLDAMSRVEVAFFGRKSLKRSTINQLYNGTGCLTYTHVQGLRMMADHFCLAEACLIADVIDWLARTQLTFVPAYVASDIVMAVSEVHSSGLLYNAVLKSPSRYVDAPKQLGSYFQRLREAGKGTFLLTNSPWRYVDGLMSELHSPQWTKLFDVIIVEAKKPSFFQGDRPFRRVNPYTSRIDWAPVDKLPLPMDGLGNVVAHGNLKTFSELTGYRKVLYAGDHLEADAREPRRYGWRSATLLPEVERDIDIQNSDAYRATFVKLLEAKSFLSNVFLCKPHLSREAKDCILREMTAAMDALRQEMRMMFGSPFGSVFSSASTSSAYGLMLLRWSDLYGASIDSFAAQPVDAFLSAGGTTRALPHDVRVVV